MSLVASEFKVKWNVSQPTQKGRGAEHILDDKANFRRCCSSGCAWQSRQPRPEPLRARKSYEKLAGPSERYTGLGETFLAGGGVCTNFCELRVEHGSEVSQRQGCQV